MKKILVVDDDEKIRLFVKEMLTHMGYSVFVASDGEEAMVAIHEHKPELMILDLAMPKMHGYEVCKAVRDDLDPEVSNIKIIVASAKNYPVDMKTAKDVGANVYLVKPFGLQELRESIGKLLGNNS